MAQNHMYDYQNDENRPSEYLNQKGIGSGSGNTGSDRRLLNFENLLITTLILITCSAILVFGNMLRFVDPQVLAFSPGNGFWFPGLFSHMFTHADFLGPGGANAILPMHYLGNMCILVFLGGSVEKLYGRYAYLTLFLVSGLLAALAQASFDPHSFLIGASGALAGVMACFVRHYPKVKLYIWGIIPMPAWVLAMLWIGMNIVGTVGASSAGVAFIAHLGGFAAGAVISFVVVPPAYVRNQKMSK